jgi:hypothetical protein
MREVPRLLQISDENVASSRLLTSFVEEEAIYLVGIIFLTEIVARTE